MNILIDHQAFSMQKYGGVSRIFAELITGFEKKKLHIDTPLFYTENEYYRGLYPNQVKNKWIDSVWIPKRSKVFYQFLPIINSIYTQLTYSKKPDFYFPTYYDSYFLKRIGNAKTILFVYDMIHELYPEMFKPNDTTRANKLKMMEHADLILPISHNTKNDILKLYPHLESKKMEVVHLSHSMTNEIIAGVKNKLPEKYILFVGSRSKYKNFTTLLHAFSKIQDTRYTLLCIGGGAFTASELDLMTQLGVEKRMKQLNLYDTELYTVYHFAEVYVFPSLYEGFGIPVIESMYASCPVILGAYSSFPEIAENACVYCDVTQADELYKAIMHVVTDREYRSKKIEEGKMQASKFSWSNAVEVTYKAICAI